jgi:cytochrome bd-type quinol oxidase subunit 2
MMNFLHRLFPAGHFVISLLFLAGAVALIGVAAVQLWQGIQLFDEMPIAQRLNAVLESIAVLTVAVAALELGQTILEEEVQREAHMSAPTRVRRFLSRFMVVLVVSLSIETVVLTFRLAQDQPEHLPYAASVGMTAALLLAAWGVFIWFNRSAEQLEPEAMQDAKREDRKIEKANKGDDKR